MFRTLSTSYQLSDKQMTTNNCLARFYKYTKYDYKKFLLILFIKNDKKLSIIYKNFGRIKYFILPKFNSNMKCSTNITRLQCGLFWVHIVYHLFLYRMHHKTHQCLLVVQTRENILANVDRFLLDLSQLHRLFWYAKL